MTISSRAQALDHHLAATTCSAGPLFRRSWWRRVLRVLAR